jgi:hypothetical protein
MLNSSASVTVAPGCRLVSVSKDVGTACLTQAAFLCANDTVPITVAASVFIDASYDGDIMVGAGGVDFAYGREPSSKYNESLAGVNLMDDPNESFDKQKLVINATFSNGTLLPGITGAPLPPAGSGDDSLMAFQYFACVSSDANNSVPYPMPDGYDPEDFTLLLRVIEGVMANGRYPNGPDLSYFRCVCMYVCVCVCARVCEWISTRARSDRASGVSARGLGVDW